MLVNCLLMDYTSHLVAAVVQAFQQLGVDGSACLFAHVRTHCQHQLLHNKAGCVPQVGVPVLPRLKQRVIESV